jgi:hypothetical protein
MVLCQEAYDITYWYFFLKKKEKEEAYDIRTIQI